MTLDRRAAITGVRALVVWAYLVYAPYYLFWRLGTFNPEALFFSWLIWIAEAFGYLTAVLHVFMVWRLTSPSAGPPPAGYSVDVFVTTYDESPSLLRHTLLAAVRMGYPHQTWLLDDGNRPEMAELAKELGCRYLARTKNTHAKAGNLNNALIHSRADFIAVFDADHVPHKDFLNKTLGFFRDEKVAFVQTPQDFYNLDSYQHRQYKGSNYVWTEQSLFFRVIQRGKDYWNAAFFCGSCAVLRRRALDEVGGFAIGTITEDLHTSIRLHKKGFRSVYYPHSLAFGLAPDSAHSFLLQRRRWGQGAMQVWRREGILFASGLTFAQRLNYLASVLTYFDGWQKAVFYLAPAVVLITGVLPIHKLGLEFLMYFIPFYILCFWAYEEVGRGYGGTLLTEQYNMARFATFAQATLGGFRKRLDFNVTPKNSPRKNERLSIAPQFVILVVSITAILIGIILWLVQRHIPTGAFWANIIWASINLGLAGAVVRFTLKRKHRRSEYRFPIPLPTLVTTVSNDQVVGLATDISADGCRLITEAPIGGSADTVEGEIFLPGGQMPFRAEIVRHPNPDPDLFEGYSLVKADHGKTRPPRRKLEYGLMFRWDTSSDAAQLENFLFGSDFQWRVLDLQEGWITPINWLATRIAPAKTAHTMAVTTGEWLPVIYHVDGDDDQSYRFGVLSRTDWSDQPARLILFEALPGRSRLELYVFGQRLRDGMKGELTEVEELETPLANIYTGKLKIFDQKSSVDRSGKRGFSSLDGGKLGVIFLLAWYFSVLFFPTGNARADNWIGLTGGEVAGDGNAYAFAGAIKPLGRGSKLGQGWVQRYWLDWAGYRFDVGGEEIRARAPGVSAAVGYQRGIAGGYMAGYVGLGYRDTRLSPDKPQVKARGGQSSFQMLGEIDRRINDQWRFTGAAHLAFGPDSYWTRAKFLFPTASGPYWRGVEIVFQGDSDYRAVKAGYVLDEWRIGRGVNANFKLGILKTEGLATRAYAGIEFVKTFR